MKLMLNEPIIKAEFVLDKDGKPIISGDRHYAIKLSTKEVPDDTYAVTYFLHDSYYDPVRESQEKKTDFAEDLTSFGDYEIKAKIRAKNSSVLISRQLSDALKETHGSSNDPDIKKALQKIESS
jgi:hypothetical protein